MAKPPSIASLVRAAAVSEASFIATMNNVLETEETERVIEIFGRVNVPKVYTELADGPDIHDVEFSVTDFELEATLASGFNTYIDRHMRKLKWHTTHASDESIVAVSNVYSGATAIAALRVRRVIALLAKKDSYSAQEWGVARELINRAFRDFRELTKVLVMRWLPAASEVIDNALLFEGISHIPALIRKRAKRFARLREEIEACRTKIQVVPDGYPPVKPPRYFGGDLMEDGAWAIYWDELGALADNLEQAIEI